MLDSLNSNLHHVLGTVVYTIRSDNEFLDDVIRPLLVANAHEPDAFVNEYNSDDDADEGIDKLEEAALLAV